MKLEPIIQSDVSQKDQYSILTHIYGILKDGNDNLIRKQKETQMYRLLDSVGEGEGGLF